ncbi:MAG: AhpC/TSA family protein [Actinomycetota bacterium]
MRILAELRPGWSGAPSVVHVMEGSLATIDDFFADRDPTVPVIADEDGSLRAELGVRRGGWWAMFGFGSWRAGIRSFLRGNLIGGREGADGWTLPLFLFVEDGAVTWRWEGRHAGDHPDFSEIARLA